MSSSALCGANYIHHDGSRHIIFFSTHNRQSNSFDTMMCNVLAALCDIGVMAL